MFLKHGIFLQRIRGIAPGLGGYFSKIISSADSHFAFAFQLGTTPLNFKPQDVHFMWRKMKRM